MDFNTFIKCIRNDIDSFEKFWLDNNKKNPKKYKMDISDEEFDWIDIFEEWQDVHSELFKDNGTVQ